MADKKNAGGNAPAKAANRAKTKSQVFDELAKSLDVKRRDVANFFEKLSEIIKKELGKRGPGVMTIPGLVKLQRVSKKATKAGQRPNPFKPGEMMEVKAKPARTVVKVRPLKNLKDLVAG
jgi:nucleoid DNA-binding protein